MKNTQPDPSGHSKLRDLTYSDSSDIPENPNGNRNAWKMNSLLSDWNDIMGESKIPDNKKMNTPESKRTLPSQNVPILENIMGNIYTESSQGNLFSIDMPSVYMDKAKLRFNSVIDNTKYDITLKYPNNKGELTIKVVNDDAQYIVKSVNIEDNSVTMSERIRDIASELGASENPVDLFADPLEAMGEIIGTGYDDTDMAYVGAVPPVHFGDTVMGRGTMTDSVKGNKGALLEGAMFEADGDDEGTEDPLADIADDTVAEADLGIASINSPFGGGVNDIDSAIPGDGGGLTPDGENATPSDGASEEPGEVKFSEQVFSNSANRGMLNIITNVDSKIERAPENLKEGTAGLEYRLDPTEVAMVFAYDPNNSDAERIVMSTYGLKSDDFFPELYMVDTSNLTALEKELELYDDYAPTPKDPSEFAAFIDELLNVELPTAEIDETNENEFDDILPDEFGTDEPVIEDDGAISESDLTLVPEEEEGIVLGGEAEEAPTSTDEAASDEAISSDLDALLDDIIPE